MRWTVSLVLVGFGALGCTEAVTPTDAGSEVDVFDFETAIPGDYTGTESSPTLGTVVAPYQIRPLQGEGLSWEIVYTPEGQPEYTKLEMGPAIPDATVSDRAHLSVPDQTYAEGNTGGVSIAFTGTGAFEASDGQTYEARYDGATGVLSLEGDVTTFGNTETLTFVFEPR